MKGYGGFDKTAIVPKLNDLICVTANWRSVENLPNFQTGGWPSEWIRVRMGAFCDLGSIPPRRSEGASTEYGSGRMGVAL